LKMKIYTKGGITYTEIEGTVDELVDYVKKLGIPPPKPSKVPKMIS